ncbi:hypothetical protein D3C71_2012980 [compost metagenome]
MQDHGDHQHLHDLLVLQHLGNQILVFIEHLSNRGALRLGHTELALPGFITMAERNDHLNQHIDREHHIQHPDNRNHTEGLDQ